MKQLIHMLQTFAYAFGSLGMFAIVYFLSQIKFGDRKPIGEFFATVVHIPGIALRSLAQLLKPYAVQEKQNTNEYPGLRTIVLVIAAFFAIVACLADGFLTVQALVVLTDDTSINVVLPANLSWLTVSQGFLLLSIPSIAGMILLDTYFLVIPEEARIFIVPTDTTAKERFEKFIKWTFILSPLASIAFNALKPAYMQDSGSMLTLALRVVVFVVLGGMLPLCMALTIYIISAAFHALLKIVITIAWFFSITGTRILGFLAHRFAPEEEGMKVTTIEFYETSGVVGSEDGKDQSANGVLPVPSKMLLAPEKEASPKSEKKGKRRILKVELTTVPVTPEQETEQPKDTSKTTPVTKTMSATKNKASSTRKRKTPVKRGVRNKTTKTQSDTEVTSDVTPAPSLNGRTKTTTTK